MEKKRVKPLKDRRNQIDEKRLFVTSKSDRLAIRYQNAELYNVKDWEYFNKDA